MVFYVEVAVSIDHDWLGVADVAHEVLFAVVIKTHDD